MMELERNGEHGLEEPMPALAPSEKWRIKDLCIDAHHSVDLTVRQSRCADNHVIVAQIVRLTCFVDLLSETQIIIIELPEVIRERDVTECDTSILHRHHHVHGQSVILQVALSHGQHVELLDIFRCSSDAPTHERVQFQALSLAQPHHTPHIESLYQRDLGHGAFFHISKDCARSVVLGSISVFIRVKFYITNNCKITYNDVRIPHHILDEAQAWNTTVRETLICGGPMIHKCRSIVTTECKGSHFSATNACSSGFCYVRLTISGEMDSFSVSTRNAEMSADSWLVSIIIFCDLIAPK